MSPHTIGETTDHEPPIACTLEPGAVADRRVAWQSMMARAESCTSTPDGSVRAVFEGHAELVEIAHLVGAEQRCCAFFTFSITSDARGIVLEAHVPAGATEIARALFEQDG